MCKDLVTIFQLLSLSNEVGWRDNSIISELLVLDLLKYFDVDEALTHKVIDLVVEPQPYSILHFRLT
jgi:hypothetical protein